MCDHSIESYWAVLSCGTVYYAVQCDFKSVDLNPSRVTTQLKATGQYFHVALFNLLYKMEVQVSDR